MLKLLPALLPSVAVVAAGCSADAASAGDPRAVDRPQGGDDPPVVLLVSAASSLADVFFDLGEAFEAAHPGVGVSLNLAGSATLRAQILEGAPVDVFASADAANMERLVEAGAIRGMPETFARNRLVLAVPEGNPEAVTGLADLADPSLLVGLCAPGVPCGELARRALAGAGVEAQVDTEEPNVRALLYKILAGELDAGLVYATDVVPGRVEAIALPDESNPATPYLAGVLAQTRHPEAAEAWVDFLLSTEGQTILSRFGFLAP